MQLRPLPGTLERSCDLPYTVELRHPWFWSSGTASVDHVHQRLSTRCCSGTSRAVWFRETRMSQTKVRFTIWRLLCGI